MYLINDNFKNNKFSFMFQLFLAVFFVFFILLLLDILANVVIVASFASSAIIIFIFPEAQVSKTRLIVGGYLAGIIAGSLCYYMSFIPLPEQLTFIQDYHYVVFGTLSVGIASTFMILTDTVHPPAVSLSLGLILHEYSFMTVIVVLAGVVLMSAVKKLFRNVLKNLI